MFLTLQESVSITSPYFLFVFTSRAGEEVKAVIERTDTNDRSDKFIIDVSTLFDGKDEGQWGYIVYEQGSDSNTDVIQTGAELERGIVQLHPETAFAYTQRTATTQFKQ